MKKTYPNPHKVDREHFNKNAIIPHGCTIEHIEKAMTDFVDFLTFIDKQLASKNMERLEDFVMPANFSSIVGEFMSASIPRYCLSIKKNKYHNGHPDLVPTDYYDGDSILHGEVGIEIKASRHSTGWQGHNPEDTWLLIFIFESNSPRDKESKAPIIGFKFKEVLGAQLKKKDWTFSGRSETSRRTITASVNRSGYEKMSKNWIYRNFD